MTSPFLMLFLFCAVETPLPRVPQQQLIIEMAALIKEQMSSVIQTNLRPKIRKVPKFRYEH